MIERLRNQYRDRLKPGDSLDNDHVLLDEAHAVYSQLEQDPRDEPRLWAAIFVYEMLISPHEVLYMRWPGQHGGHELAEFLGDFEMRRVTTDGLGNPTLWTDMAEVTWPDGNELRVTDQPMDFEAALAGGAEFIPRSEFDDAWVAATARTMPGHSSPMLAASVVATFEELRIARGL